MQQATYVPIEDVDLSIRDGIDAEILVKNLLEREWPDDDTSEVAVRGGIDPSTDATTFTKTVVVYSVGETYQPDANLKAWSWRVPVSFTVMSHDSVECSQISRRLDRLVASWPWQPGVPGVGKVARVLSNTTGHRVEASMSAAKSVHVRVSDKLIEAYSPN